MSVWQASHTKRTEWARTNAFTLAEVVISLAIAALLIGTILYGYTTSATRVEWSGYSLAAHSLAMQRMEQIRGAQWLPLNFPIIDELVSSNFPPTVELLDMPVSGTNLVYATNIATISWVSTNPPLKAIQIQCLWSFPKHGLYTNTITTYRAPDQ